MLYMDDVHENACHKL